VSASNEVPIAIVGMGCRLPGGVESPDSLWELAAAGLSTAGPVPADRWDAARLAGLHDPELMSRATVGCFVQGDVWAWEPEAFAVAPAERESVDPQARIMMEVAWEAVQHAGIPVDRIRGTRTGVWIGNYSLDNLLLQARPVEDAADPAYLFGNFPAGVAGRVAFSMDLRGPVMVVSTHCSSSLVAVDAACGALTLGECDMAVAGGVMLMLAPQTHYCEAPLLLSRSGSCHAFDVRADGYVRGEGAGAVLLKRLADAQRDGDRVLAVIRGSVVNNDGQATRLTAPSAEMQRLLFGAAVERAGIDPGEAGLVEAHGPGTLVGDPIEFSSINAVYGPGRGGCALGSVKTNIGHTEPVSGVAGLIKAVECLRRGLIPPNKGFGEWNQGIDRAGSRLFVPTEVIAWPVPGEVRLAAVCSYGVSGTNAHLVLEAAPKARQRVRATPPVSDDTQLFLLSGASDPSLRRTAARLAEWVAGAGAGVPLVDTAHTLAVRRSHAEHRLGIVARDAEELRRRARAFAAGESADGIVGGTPVLPPGHAGPVFVFTGQGSQRPGMCQELLVSEPVFSALIDELEPLIQAESGFSLREMIMEPDGLVGVDRIQPTLFAVQLALTALWKSWGVTPAAVIGQSLGEVAAAVVAGALTLQDGVKVICRRANLLVTIAGGAMASVMLGAAETQDDLDAAGADLVSVGVLTGPSTTVISGDAEQVRAMVEAWNAQGIVSRMVDVDVASHSCQVDPVIDELHDVLSFLPDIRPASVVAFLSTVDEDVHTSRPLNAGYWVRNQRDTVRFQQAVRAALADGHRLFIECTAHPLAARPIMDTAHEADVHDVVAVGSLRRGSDDQEAFLAHLAAVHGAGFDGIDWTGRYGEGDLAEIPGTAWNRVRHGGGRTPYTLVAPHLPAASQHPLLGGHVADPDHPGRHLWQTPISPHRLPWLADHQVAGKPVLPGTGFAEMLLAAGTEVLETNSVELTGLRVEHPLVLDPEPQVTIRLACNDDTAHGEILTRTSDGTVLHARGSIRPLTRAGQSPGPRPVTAEWDDSEPAELYRHFRDRHDVFHGPSFSAIDRIRLSPDRRRAVAAVRIADSARVSAAAMRLHPALADEVVQTVVAAWLGYCATSPGPVVVAGFDEIRLHASTAHTKTVHIDLHDADDLHCTASATLHDPEGTVVAELRGLRLANITPPEQRYASRLAHLAWTVQEPPPAAETRAGRWLIAAPDDLPWAARLSTLIADRSEDSELIVHPAAQGVDADRLSSALDLPDRPPPAVVVLVLNQPVDDDPIAASRAGVRNALTVIRLLSAQSPSPRLWVMWRDDSPSAAGLSGLLRTTAYELPDLRISSMALSGHTPLDGVVTDLLHEHPPIEIAWRHGIRHVAHVRTGPGPRSSGLAKPIMPGAGYLVTGGLGGLGLLTVRRMAERGAGRIVICGRTTPTDEVERELTELGHTTGADLRVFQGDIADDATVRDLIANANGDGIRLRGIVHAAGVIEDATLFNLTEDLMERVWRGKAAGAWALHHATRHLDLDFFAVYSSVASLLGSPGQAAYASANTFLDALVGWRLADGLPATGIHWGAWSQIGRGQHLAQRGFVMISPDDGLDAFEQILTEGHHHVAYSPIDPTQWITPYPHLRRSALFTDLLSSVTAIGEQETSVRDELFALDNPTARRRRLENFIIDEVRELLGGTNRHIGAHTSLVILGMDSLGAVQLQQRLQKALRTDIKPGVIWVAPSAAALTDWLMDHMGLAESD
jgi:acyl transferase domain-containing protein/acyl carrier protein